MFKCNVSVNEYGLTFLFELNVCKTQYNGKFEINEQQNMGQRTPY